MSQEIESIYQIDLKTAKTILSGDLVIKSSSLMDLQTLTISLDLPSLKLLPGDEFLIKIKQ